jgi:type II secretory pathway pseudopilin PulG
MRRARQCGASAVLILLVLVLLLVGFAAAYTLKRIGSSGDERDDTLKRLNAAAAALERFAAANGYLPCPANPTLATGVADVASAKKCNHGDDGTIPWATIGLTSDAGLDGWGRKISYRVYTGGATGKGSLTQPRGVNMVECDITDPTPGDVDADGLCVSNPDPYQRSTTRASFLAGKGLGITDYGTAHGDAAYVLISHGATGLGAWTIAGTQLDMPNGAERNNTRETGPFTIQAFSDPDTSATAGTHFDDLLVYATISDLVKRIGLEAREWPETSTSSVVLTKANVQAATGTTVAPSGDTGSASVDFGNARISGFTGTNTATDVSWDQNASGGGTGGIGVINGGTGVLMSSNAGEWLRVDLTSAALTFAITLDNFGTYSLAGTTYSEKVELRFYNGSTQVGSTVTLAGCRADGDLASFTTLAPGAAFTSIDIVPVGATGSPSGTSDSSLLVAEIQACDVSASTCKTSLWTGANKCN